MWRAGPESRFGRARSSSTAGSTASASRSVSLVVPGSVVRTPVNG
jgi:hypothetical protein